MIKHNGHSIFTRVRKVLISKPVKQIEAGARDAREFVADNSGLLAALATGVGAALAGPVGAEFGGFIGGGLGSMAEAGVNHSAARRNKKDAESKLEEERRRAQRDLDARNNAAEANINRERENLNAADEKVEQARANLNQNVASENSEIEQSQLVSDILNCIMQRRLNELPNLLRGLNDVGRTKLGGRFATGPVDDRPQILEMYAQAQQAQQQVQPENEAQPQMQPGR